MAVSVARQIFSREFVTGNDFHASSKVLAAMRVKEIPQEQPLRRPQHLRHIPIIVLMRIRVKGATTRRGARNIGGVGDAFEAAAQRARQPQTRR
jgi:hypothetical protein